MILNDELGFLWIHAPKSGGVSIRASNSHLNSDPSRALRIIDWVALQYPTFAGGNNRGVNAGHLPAWAIRDALIALGEYTMEQWTALDKWVVIRNPWDHAHSLWKFEKRNADHHRHELVRNMTFPQWITNRLQESREIFQREQLGRVRRRLPEYFTARMIAENPEDDDMWSDFNYVYFDDLADSWATMAHHMNRKAQQSNIPVRIEPVLPHLNTSGPKNDYVGDYNIAPGLMRWIQDIYEPEFRFFGWQPPKHLKVPHGSFRDYHPRVPQGHRYVRQD
jgi:hypothetical protein